MRDIDRLIEAVINGWEEPERDGQMDRERDREEERERQIDTKRSNEEIGR